MTGFGDTLVTTRTVRGSFREASAAGSASDTRPAASLRSSLPATKRPLTRAPPRHSPSKKEPSAYVSRPLPAGREAGQQTSTALGSA